MWDLLISPIVGAIGGIVTQVISYKTHQVDVADRDKARLHEREMATLMHSQALEMTRAEQAGIERRVAIEGDIAAVQSDLANLGRALDSVPRWTGIQQGDTEWLKWWKVVIESLQTLVRVVVTVWLTYQMSDLADRATSAFESTPIEFSPAEAVMIYMLVMRGLVELAGLAVGFWFGSRGAQLLQQRAAPPR